jgi:flagellar hook-associated protein 1 FlgK
MGISSALSTALSGLRLAQNGLDFVAQNVASANTPGYTRKVLQPNARIAAGKIIGVDTQSVARVLDTLLQKQLRIESAGSQYTQVQSNFQSRLDSLYGPPGSTSALDSIFHDFTGALQDLVTSPESPQAQSAALQKAALLASRVNGISNDIQTMRGEAEQGIADGVRQANDLLGRLKTIDQQVVAGSVGSEEPVNLLDQRDQILNDLSKLMDIRITKNSDNSVTVYTGTGAVLFDRQPSVLSFDARTDLTPQSVYDPDPSARSVGTITLTSPGGYQSDLIAQHAIRSGSIASYIALRDDVLVKAQDNLDEFASGMALALSAQTQSSSAVTAAGLDGRQIDIANLKPGDSITMTVTSGGVPRTVTIVRVDDPSQLPVSANDVGGTSGEVYGVSFTNLASAASSIQGILGPGFTVTNPGGTLLNVLDDGGAATTDVTGLSGRMTATTLTSGEAAAPFFTDGAAVYTANLESGKQKTGFSARMVVNADLLNDPTRLVNMGSGAFNAGDPTRPQALLDRLTSLAIDFAPSQGLTTSSIQGTAESFLQRIINNVGQNAATAQQLNDGQTIVANGLQERFDQSSKVNVDEEMAHLIELQQTYQASARVMNIANAMLQELMNTAQA